MCTFPELRHIDVMCINYSGSVVSIYLVPRNRCSIELCLLRCEMQHYCSQVGTGCVVNIY